MFLRFINYDPRTVEGRLVSYGMLMKYRVTGLVGAGMALAVFATASIAQETSTYALGVGVERMPGWVGSSDHRSQAVPYIDIDVPHVGSISTTDGLELDFIDGEAWHGGIYGNYLWGRTRDSLGKLGGKIPPLSPRIHGGGYLEYRFDKTFSMGAQLSHDTRGAGVYTAIYGDANLPGFWYVEHSIEVQWNGMNGAAMRRFFGVTQDQAQAIGTSPWRPGAGAELATIEYDAFIPTSQKTGFALAINVGRLQGDAARSPLVRSYGSATQVTTSLAWLVHF